MISEDIPLTVFLGILFFLMVLMASGGNLLVCAAIVSDRRLRRQKENLFLMSLAISDLLVSVLVMVFAAVNDLLGYWPFGTVYCRVWISLDIMCCTASIVNMCAIAFDRYFHISNPLKYEQYVTRRRILWVILALWILSATVGSLQQVFQAGKKERSENKTGQTVKNETFKCRMDLGPEFAIASSMLSFFLPATVMILAYWKLYRCARRHLRSIRTQIRAVTEALIAHTKKLYYPRDKKDWDGHSPTGHQKDISDQKARITLGVIIGVFLVCWLPFFCVNIISSLSPNLLPHQVFTTFTWFGYFNSTANPIIYSIFNRDFRLAFQSVLKQFCYHRKTGHPAMASFLEDDPRTFHSYNPDTPRTGVRSSNRRFRDYNSVNFQHNTTPASSYGATDEPSEPKTSVFVTGSALRNTNCGSKADTLIVLDERRRSISVNAIFTASNSEAMDT